MHQMDSSQSSDSSDRKPGEYLLFATGFLGFGIAVAGIILSSPSVAMIGGLILLLAISGFRSPTED